MSTLFIEPVDVLALRGNKLFGDAGSYGESLVLPWPSVAAGAIRSMVLARDGAVRSFTNGQGPHPELGTPAEPGPFTITAFHVAWRRDSRVEPLYSLPADVVVEPAPAGRRALYVRPHTPVACIAASRKFRSLAVLGHKNRLKPISGLWLTAAGWRSYLADQPIASQDLVESQQLWGYDLRVGIGLSGATRHVEEGKLFSANTVAFKRDVGFLVRLAGLTSPPPEGMLRFGGDGRGAHAQPVDAVWPQPDYDAIARAGRARLVLTSPGLFTAGWLPTGTSQHEDSGYHFGGCPA